jgi:hypothetical protein
LLLLLRTLLVSQLALLSPMLGWDAAGSVIDIDGIAVDIALATLVDGAGVGVTGCAGAYVANAGGAGQLVDADAWPVITYVAAAYTAGAGKLIVEYVRVA